MAKVPVIKLKDVTKKFMTGSEEMTILKEINLEIFAGEYVIFYGASGSGKSTILNTICGLEPPSTGEVTIRGENIAKLKPKELAKFRRSKIGIVFQQFNLIKTFRVWENVAFPLTTNGESRGRRKERALMLLRLLGLEKHAYRRPSELSGGQQQRVAIARALASNPWILIADEPTGNLDSKSADDVIEIFRLLNGKSRRTVIMVTHNPDYLKEADRIFYVQDGQIVKEKRNRHTPEFGSDVKGLEDLRSLSFKEDNPEAEKKHEHKKSETAPATKKEAS